MPIIDLLDANEDKFEEGFDAISNPDVMIDLSKEVESIVEQEEFNFSTAGFIIPRDALLSSL